MKILTNMAHLQYHPRECHIKATQQVWWTCWINWLNYCVNKDDGNRQTDRRTDGQTQVTTITLRPKRPRVNNRAPLLCCFKLCASFHSHRWIQTKVTVRKRSIRVQIGDLLSRVTLKFDGWPWKTIGHLFYVASSFMHHFIVIGEFTLKLQSGNAQFGSKSMIFLAVWPWNLMDDLEKQ